LSGSGGYGNYDYVSSGLCHDEEGWKGNRDTDGNFQGCEMVARSARMGDTFPCENFADAGTGMLAQEACCGCGTRISVPPVIPYFVCPSTTLPAPPPPRPLPPPPLPPSIPPPVWPERAQTLKNHSIQTTANYVMSLPLDWGNDERYTW